MKYSMLKLSYILVLLSVDCLQAQYMDEIHCGQLDYLYDLTTCIKMRWMIQPDPMCQERDTHEVYVDECNGTIHTFRIHNNNKSYIDLGFSPVYCKSKCLIRFQDSNLCTLLNASDEYRNSKYIIN